MDRLIRKWIAAFFFTLFCISCMSVPISAIAEEPTTTQEPTDEEPEEEPDCD